MKGNDISYEIPYEKEMDLKYSWEYEGLIIDDTGIAILKHIVDPPCKDCDFVNKDEYENHTIYYCTKEPLLFENCIYDQDILVPSLNILDKEYEDEKEFWDKVFCCTQEVEDDLLELKKVYDDLLKEINKERGTVLLFKHGKVVKKHRGGLW